MILLLGETPINALEILVTNNLLNRLIQQLYP